jgi:DNA-binding NtrC family response regulator
LAAGQHPKIASWLTTAQAEREIHMDHLDDSPFDNGRDTTLDDAQTELEQGALIATFSRPPAPARGRRAAARVSLEGENSFAGMVGRSDPMRQVFSQIERVGPSDTTVTIVGESGTGKELAAQALHDLSPRRHAPFIAVNCGAIPANLAEAEFFGFEKGAFTGAQRQHCGHFERANGGTLFLDEITEMPFDLQVKLLRVLEMGRIVRVGGTDEIDVDVRVIAATNRDPLQAVHEGRLREDLYYRLTVFPLRLPALRERGEDVMLIAQAFLASLNAKYGTSKRFGEAAVAAMRAASWPGNVRELRNSVERAYILAENEVMLECPVHTSAAAIRVGPDGCLRVPLGSTVAQAEREMILATIHHCGGSKRKAADVLGISLKTVYNKLAEYGAEEGRLRLANAN